MKDQITHLTVETDPSYPVVIGSGVGCQLTEFIPPRAARVMVLHAPPLQTAAKVLENALAKIGLQTYRMELPNAEAAKQVEVAAGLWRHLGQAAFTRTDLVVTLGGGATSDIGGFVASTFLRGLAVIHLPTSLLGMVDAAIGGKTAIDTDQGKNLVGTFHQPRAVLCDLDHLSTLPALELQGGLAEVIKCGLVADQSILDLIRAASPEDLQPGSPMLGDLIGKAAAVKAQVVSMDPGERGWRAVLNYGHTFG
ncbi:MAG: iron-containing alcohol dehydrogenase, partial [Micrococcales bacterium]|nr:iron-containing alcohol dehydrogenase [Micrococcales bacterium]